MSIPSDPSRGARLWTRGVLIALVTGLALPAATMLTGRSAEAAMAKKGKKKKRRAKRKRRQKKKQQAAAALASTCEVRTSDIIQTKIDIGAQYSMMRKMSGDETSRLEASSILHAIDTGALAAVLLPPRKAVSDRGQRMSPQRGYWTMIPKGKNSVCLKEPAGEAPMILYRENLQPPQIDAAITKAWKDCEIRPVPRACEYIVDLHKPDWDCTTDEECQDRHGSELYFCNPDTHTCALDMAETELETSCELPPNCIVGNPASTMTNCGGSWGDNLCLPRAGKKCGVCQGQTNKAKTCHDKNNEKHTKARAKCKADHSPGKTAGYAAKCVAHILKCYSNPLKSPKDCADAIKCGVDPEPVKQYQQCFNTENQRWSNERDRCKTL